MDRRVVLHQSYARKEMYFEKLIETHHEHYSANYKPNLSVTGVDNKRVLISLGHA